MKDHLLVILVLILIASLSGCASVGTLLVPDEVVEDNCSWLLSATSEITSTYIDPSSYIGVGSYSLINLIQLQADVQCFSSGIEVQDVFTQGANQIVNILVPDDNLSGSTWPVWGIVSGDFGDEKYPLKLLKLINISKRGSIKVSRVDNYQLRVDLDSAVVADSQNVGDGNVTSAFLELQTDDSGGITKITLKVGDKEILMTKEQVGAQVGGGFILGAVDAFQQQEVDLQVNSIRAGVSPDLSFATGIGVGIEGEVGESLRLNDDLQAALNSQGFIPVIGAGSLLNIHQEGTIGVCTTEVLADRYNPANVYNLVQNENGEWSPVHPGQAPLVTADGLVAFGDKQGNPVEWMIAAVPNMFGNLEPVTLIVKDQSRISDRLKDLGYEYVNATVFTALIDPDTGEIQSLVPSIHEGEIKMSQNGQGKLAITVSNGDIQNYELVASSEAFIPVLPEGSESYDVWQDANGQWVAGKRENNQTLMQFDSEKDEWIKLMAPRPDFESMSDMEMAQAIYDYGVLIESQLHFSPEEIEALPFASAPPELIHNYSIQYNMGLIEWSAEAVGEKEVIVNDKNGLPIGTVRLGFFGGIGDAPGNRKIFTALIGARFWQVKPQLSSEVKLGIGRRYDLRVSYPENTNTFDETMIKNLILEQRYAAAKGGFSEIEENLFFSIIIELNDVKIGSIDKFYQGLPTDPNIILWPEGFELME